MKPRAAVVLVVLAALALLAVLLMQVERGRADAGRGAPASQKATEAVLVDAAAPPAERSSPRSQAGVAEVTGEPAEEDLGGPAPARHARRHGVTGRVVDENGAGIAGAEVSFCFAGYRGRAARELVARSGADGAFAGEFGTEHSWIDFLVLADGRVRADLQVRAETSGAIQLGTIVLLPGADVRGVVVDASGAPVVGAWVVRVHPADALPADEESARTRGIEDPERGPTEPTDEQGRFHLRGVGIGPRFVSAHRYGSEGLGWCEPFELLAGDTQEVRIVVPMSPHDPEIDRIEGIVRDPAGQPLDGVQITVSGRENAEWAVSEADGAFSVHASWLHEDGGVARVFANDPELRFGPVAHEGIAPGTRGVELTLAPPSWIRLELRDPGGELIPWGHVRAAPRPHFFAPVPELDLGRSGKARIPRPVQTLALEADAPGFRKRTFGPYEPDALPDELVLVLEAGQSLRGRVSFEGRPVAGAALDLCRTVAPGKWGESSDVAPLDHPFAIAGRVELEGNDGTSDARGEFVLTIPDDGWYGLRVEAEGFPTLVRGPFELSTAGHEGFEIELERGGALEGRVLLAAGAAPLGRIVGISDGWGYARTTAALEDGRFRFDALAPGRYQVRSCAPPVGARQALWLRGPAARDDPIEWDCVVATGATTRFDVDLTQEGSCVLAGSFVLGSEDPRAWRAELHELAGEAMRAHAPIDRNGRFLLAVSTPGSYRLRLWDHSRAITADVVLVPGELVWELRRDAGLLRIVVGDDVNESGAVDFVQEPAGAPRFQATLWLEVDGDEDYQVVVPSGPGRLELRGKRDTPQRTLAELEIRSGAETVFTLSADAF